MPQAVSRATEQALKDLRLDETFFKSMLANVEEVDRDFDIYLMEKGVMPLLLQGLDALSRHVDKLSSGNTIGLSTGSKQPFNPLTWLAQYLLRNHPKFNKDHRTPIYQQLGELADIERSRRNLLRREDEMRRTWILLAEERQDPEAKLSHEDIPVFFQVLDEKWFLDGQLSTSMPVNFARTILADESDKISWEEFWPSYEEYVQSSNVLRASVFEEAQLRKDKADREVHEENAETNRREMALAHARDQRRKLEEQFETLRADAYINGQIGQIINKGAVLSGPQFKGEHIQLIHMLLRIWGCPAQNTEEAFGMTEEKDEWDSHSVEAWRRWVLSRGPEGANPDMVDSVTLKALLDREAFEVYLLHAQEASSNEFSRRRVEVWNVIESEYDDDKVFVEAIDLEAGEELRLELPRSKVDNVRRRLSSGESSKLLATADPVSLRFIELI